MNRKNSIVTLLTDFGTQDGYVGAMKGVLLDGFPNVTVVDISHEIEPFNVRQGAFALLNYAAYFPENTIHIVVVDPGVGTSRRGLVIRAGDYWFIGPDNGVFSFIVRSDTFQAYTLREKEFADVSSTFHGRDIFAPAATRLLLGQAPQEFAEPAADLTSFYDPYVEVSANEYLLTVIHTDHFGNIIFNFTIPDWKKIGSPSNIKIRLKSGFLYGIKNTFGDAREGQIMALWDSSGFLQISRNRGNAAEVLKMQVGDHVMFST